MTTQSDETIQALMGKDISQIQKDLGDIKTSVKELAGVYITKLQFDDLQKAVESRLVAVEKSKNLWRVLSPLLSSVLTAVLTFLLIFFLQNVKH